MTVAEYAALCSKETSRFHYTFSKSKDKHESKRRNINEIPETHAAIAVTTYLSYSVLILIGHIRDFLRKLGLMKHGKSAVKDVSNLYYDLFVMCMCDFQVLYAYACCPQP